MHRNACPVLVHTCVYIKLTYLRYVCIVPECICVSELKETETARKGLAEQAQNKGERHNGTNKDRHSL